MDSNELLRFLYKKYGTKQIADVYGVSESTLHKWSEQGENHRKNPLEDLQKLAVAVKWDDELMHWLCEQAGGYFVHNPAVPDAKPARLLPAENAVVHDFAQMVVSISDAAKDEDISQEDSKIIRDRWDRLKSLAEGFVLGCEKGNFDMYHAHAAVHATRVDRATI